MAGDLQYTEGGHKKFKGAGKIYKFDANEIYSDADFMVGFAGTASDIIAVVDFFSMPGIVKPPKVRNLTGLVLTAKKEIFLFDDYTKWLRIKDSYYSIGSGSSIALGAMSLGCTPKEAVKTASKYDVYTGMGYQVVRFE
jgi:ATP-dependent protease HslVU (ClpYQ) peptidase subunit